MLTGTAFFAASSFPDKLAHVACRYEHTLVRQIVVAISVKCET